MAAGDIRLRLRPNLHEAVLNEAVDPQLERYGARWEDAAYAQCPKDTGYLSSTIYHTVENHVLYCGATASYTVPVHEGHTTSSGSEVPENPFLLRSMMEVFR